MRRKKGRSTKTEAIMRHRAPVYPGYSTHASRELLNKDSNVRRLLPGQREWASISQAAKYYGVSKGTIYRWINEGKFAEGVKRRWEGGTIVDLAAGPKRQPDNGARNQ